LQRPAGLYAAKDGTLYVADRENHRVMKYSPTGGRNGTQIGNGRGIGPRELSFPQAIAVDEEKNLVYISDYGNNRIQLWNEGGLGLNVETVIVKSTNFSRADDIQLDLRSNDTLYILDSRRQLVSRWNLRTVHVENTVALLYGSSGIHVDAQQNIIDANCDQNLIFNWPQYRTLAGTRNPGNKLNQFNCPSAVVVDSRGNMFISDKNNHRIMLWKMNADKGICLAGCPSARGSGNYRLTQPTDVIFDRQGNLLVADTENHRVQRFDMFIDQSCGKCRVLVIA
jgi:sugar lactone lactonase YvrE